MKISFLKKQAHDLLDEYISLLQITNKRNRKKTTNLAYEKLAKRIQSNPHFSKMETHEEVLFAIRHLHEMIRQQKKKVEKIIRWKKNDVVADLSKIKYPENPIVKRTNIIQKVLSYLTKE